MPVQIIEKDLSSIDPPHNDMMQRSGRVYAGLAGHANFRSSLILFRQVYKLRARCQLPWQGGLLPGHRRQIPGCHTAIPFASIGLGLGLDEL
jgi:hypothetical protein